VSRPRSSGRGFRVSHDYATEDPGADPTAIPVSTATMTRTLDTLEGTD
jgi:hypothetical protein